METGNIFIRHWTDIFQGLRKNTSIHMEMHMIWQALITEKLMDMFRKRCAENGIIYDPNECFRYLHELPDKYVQMFLNLT